MDKILTFTDRQVIQECHGKYEKENDGIYFTKVIFLIIWAFISKIFCFVLFCIPIQTYCQTSDSIKNQSKYKNYIEVFPIVAAFKIYSIQYSYAITKRDNIIIGFTFLNNDFPNRINSIGQFNAPTLPIGYRRHFWRNFHIEIQLWPSYDFYFDKLQSKYYNSFDLTGIIRSGYRFDFKLSRLPLFVNIQFEYLFGLYEGRKPDSFRKTASEQPPYIMPSLSLGFRY